MSNPKTRVAILLDKSGSMANAREQTVSGFNEQVQQVKQFATDGQEIMVSLVTFNGNVFEHFWDRPADELTTVAVEDYQPSGGTSMLDAVGYTIQKLLDTAPADDSDWAYLIIVLSDGKTLNDQHYTRAMVKELHDGCKITNRWTITYMGCGEEYLNEIARDTGVSGSNVAAWSNQSAKLAAAGFGGMNMRSAKYFDDRKKGVTSKLDYMNDNIGIQANFVTDVPLDLPITSNPSTPVAASWGDKIGGCHETKVFSNCQKVDIKIRPKG